MAPNVGAILTGDQVRKLAGVMYRQGAQAIHTVKFRSEYKRGQYMKQCRGAYVDTLSLLTTVDKAMADSDPLWAPVVYEASNYAKGCIEFAYASIELWGQRAVFIQKLKEHVAKILDTIRESRHSPDPTVRLAWVEREVSSLSTAMRSYFAEASRVAARKFSNVLRITISFNKLRLRSQAVLRFKGRFQNLGLDRQMQVMNKVIESTGAKLVKYGKKAEEIVGKYGGKAVYALTALTVAADLYAADPDKRYETAVKSVVVVGGAILVAELEALILECAFALICTGNPFLIAGGIALGVADFFLASALLNFINDYLAPAVVDFMNREEVKRIVPSCIFFISPLLSSIPLRLFFDPSAVGRGKDETVFDLIISLLGLDRIGSWFGSQPSKDEHKEIGISTRGFIVRAPQLPDGRYLALQIASRAQFV